MRTVGGTARAPAQNEARRRKVRSVPWAKRPADETELALEDLGAIFLAFAAGVIAVIVMVRVVAF
jgi:hypothetical protein